MMKRDKKSKDVRMKKEREGSRKRRDKEEEIGIKIF
jgi:hypothetical protein